MDTSESLNPAKLVGTYNGESISYNYFRGTPTNPSNNPGVHVGAHSNGSYKWTGEIAEIIYFDQKLSDENLASLNDYLLRKYAIKAFCTIAEGSTTGYDTSNCDTSSGTLSEANCSISCDTENGYFDITTPTALARKMVEPSH